MDPVSNACVVKKRTDVCCKLPVTGPQFFWLGDKYVDCYQPPEVRQPSCRRLHARYQHQISIHNTHSSALLLLITTGRFSHLTPHLHRDDTVAMHVVNTLHFINPIRTFTLDFNFWYFKHFYLVTTSQKHPNNLYRFGKTPSPLCRIKSSSGQNSKSRPQVKDFF